MLSRLMTRKEQAVMVFLAAAVLIGGVAVYAARDSGPAPLVLEYSQPDVAVAPDRGDLSLVPVSESSPSGSVEVASPITGAEVVVSLVGAVARPGVYTLDAGSRVQDLLRSSGGALGDADTSDINLAAMLIDGTTLIIPNRDDALEVNAIRNISDYTISGWSGGSSNGASTAAYSGRVLDLNHASAAQLETLPGIGPKLAGEIVRYRDQTPLRSVSDVMNVSGIGTKRFEAIQDLVMVQ